jgi:hypothetical protein
MRGLGLDPAFTSTLAAGHGSDVPGLDEMALACPSVREMFIERR